MTKTEAIRRYEMLPDNERMELFCEFDNIYDNLGDREVKFYRWLKNVKKIKKVKIND